MPELFLKVPPRTADFAIGLVSIDHAKVHVCLGVGADLESLAVELANLIPCHPGRRDRQNRGPTRRRCSCRGNRVMTKKVAGNPSFFRIGAATSKFPTVSIVERDCERTRNRSPLFKATDHVI